MAERINLESAYLVPREQPTFGWVLREDLPTVAYTCFMQKLGDTMGLCQK